MKGQWGLILAVIFALLISVFAVINVDPVAVNYVFGTAEWPLIIVILTSVLMGAIIIGSVGIYRVFRLQQQLKKANRENLQLKSEIDQVQPQKEHQPLEIAEEASEQSEEQKANL